MIFLDQAADNSSSKPAYSAFPGHQIPVPIQQPPCALLEAGPGHRGVSTLANEGEQLCLSGGVERTETFMIDNPALMADACHGTPVDGAQGRQIRRQHRKLRYAYAQSRSKGLTNLALLFGAEREGLAHVKSVTSAGKVRRPR